MERSRKMLCNFQQIEFLFSFDGDYYIYSLAHSLTLPLLLKYLLCLLSIYNGFYCSMISIPLTLSLLCFSSVCLAFWLKLLVLSHNFFIFFPFLQLPLSILHKHLWVLCATYRVCVLVWLQSIHSLRVIFSVSTNKKFLFSFRNSFLCFRASEEI
jgi:hypothetical protein